MEYTKIPVDTKKNIQLNAGILLDAFDPVTSVIGNILGATSGGVNFNASPTYSDWGEDIDNAPTNVLELKELDAWESVTMSGTFVTVSPGLAKQLVGAADIDAGDSTHVVPRNYVLTTDFKDIWWVGDYSDKNTGENAGFLAIHLFNALSTGGFQIQSNDDGKGTLSFTFTGHYSIQNQDKVPFEIYAKHGGEPETQPSANLTSIILSGLTLTPEFDAETTVYTASTNDASATITVTPEDDAATVEILNGTDTVENGGTATWTDGDNTVSITVTNDTVTKTYTVTVTATLS